MDREVLFAEGELDQWLAQVARRGVQAADGLTSAELEGREDAEVAEEIVAKLTVEVPVLHLDRQELSHQETKMDVSGDPLRDWEFNDRPLMVKAHRWTLHTPFSGDAAVFKYRPSQRYLSRVFGWVDGDEVCVSIQFPEGRDVDVQAKALEEFKSIQGMLNFAREDIDKFNAQLVREVSSAIARRRAAIAAQNERLAGLTIPVRRQAEPDAKPAQGVRRRAARPLPSAQSNATPSTKASVTLAHEYRHILDVIRRYARQMERSPGSFASSEEGRRDAVLAALGTHYEGQAFAEAFNRRGKTDILIREGEHNLFICECKIWKGPKEFGGALDQLLGYATWHDTRLALLVFVEQRELSRVVAGARDVLESREGFGGWRGVDDTEIQCELQFPGDPAQRLQLAVLFVHLVG